MKSKQSLCQYRNYTHENNPHSILPEPRFTTSFLRRLFIYLFIFKKYRQGIFIGRNMLNNSLHRWKITIFLLQKKYSIIRCKFYKFKLANPYL